MKCLELFWPFFKEGIVQLLFWSSSVTAVYVSFGPWHISFMMQWISRSDINVMMMVTYTGGEWENLWMKVRDQHQTYQTLVPWSPEYWTRCSWAPWAAASFAGEDFFQGILTPAWTEPWWNQSHHDVMACNNRYNRLTVHRWWSGRSGGFATSQTSVTGCCCLVPVSY